MAPIVLRPPGGVPHVAQAGQGSGFRVWGSPA